MNIKNTSILVDSFGNEIELSIFGVSLDHYCHERFST